MIVHKDQIVFREKHLQTEEGRMSQKTPNAYRINQSEKKEISRQ